MFNSKLLNYQRVTSVSKGTLMLGDETSILGCRENMQESCKFLALQQWFPADLS